MELERRGAQAYLVVSRAFEPLVRIQARQEGVAPRLIVVDHPIGGLNPEQLSERIAATYSGLVASLDAIDATGGGDEFR